MRTSGIVLHITSLPGRFGIGNLGPAAYRFVDFLARSGQTYWQILPLCPTSPGLGHSPYTGLSAFAGNPLMISPELLVHEGFLCPEELEHPPECSEYLVEFERVAPWIESLLAKAYERLPGTSLAGSFQDFLETERGWLDEYTLFMALREHFSGQPWYAWPIELRRRRSRALADARGQFSDRVRFHAFCQFLFFRQWQRLKQYAAGQGVRFIGDIPIYVALDSVDVWANQECFKLDPETGRPLYVAGVPPDYFSDTGQRWGNPLFRWNCRDQTVRRRLLAWWTERFRHIFRFVDVARIDHFRGFASYWQIPAEESSAVNGRWVKGPGKGFFRAILKELGNLPLIAEDLGVITQDVEELRDAFHFPGMKVLQFAFDSDMSNPYLPHNYTTTNCVVYTGTHDNDTTVGWFLSDRLSSEAKERVLRYVHAALGTPIHWDFIRLAYGSIARIAMVPLQDVLGFGSDCRMNTPSEPVGNWRWRVAERFLTPGVADQLAGEVSFYNRRP